MLAEEEVRAALPLEELAAALTTALVALSRDRASVPPRIAAVTERGLLAAMPGHVAGLGLAAKLISVYGGNRALGLASHQGVVVAFDEETGRPCAVMAAAYLTAIRTAVTTALAVRALRRPPARRLAILGAGAQARAHLQALSQLVGFEEIRIASRDRVRATALAQEHSGAAAARSAADAVRGAQVVCCCTSSASAVLQDEWLGSATLVTSVGSGAELPETLLRRARVVVESRDAAAAPPVGAVELQGVDPSTLLLLGDLLAGSVNAADDDRTTVFKSTGNAAEDVAAASVVLRLHRPGAARRVSRRTKL